MKKTYYAVSSAGVALTGKSFVLKDRQNLLPDVAMTELGLGNYEADLPAGTAWNIYDGVTSADIAMDVLLAEMKEPIISAGNSAHVYFGNKQFRAIEVSDVNQLATHLNNLAATDANIYAALALLQAQVGTPSAPPARTFEFNGKTYSMDPITVLNTFGGLSSNDEGGTDSFIMLGITGGSPFTVNVPGDGSWVDAFRVSIDTSIDELSATKGFVLPGLVDNLYSTLEFPYVTKDMIPYVDFRYTLLQCGIGKLDSEISAYTAVGTPVIAKQIAYLTGDTIGIGSGYVSHCVRGLGAQLSECGAHLSLKIEVRLKTPSSPISKTFTSGTLATIAGQLYPEVL